MSWRERLGFPDGDGRASLGAAATLLAGLACAFVFLRGVPSAMRAPRRYRTVASDADARRERYAVVGKLPNPALGDIPTLVAEMRDAFESGVTLPIANRRETLRAMLALVVENERLILDAVWEDLKRPTGETLYYDVLMIKSEIKKLLKNLKRWTRPERVRAFSLLTFPSSQWIEKDPRGTVLVVGPFNYPFQLTLGVAAGAVAAGCNVVLKPSADVPASSNLLADLVARYLDPRVVSVVGQRIPGDGVDAMQALLKERFDFIFFTGSTRVGAIVAKSAAETLTPCALELGGKNPTFVTASADLSIAAKQIAWGRTLNCGQQCIAPEYVLCHRSALDAFVEKLRYWINELIPDPYADGAMGRIVEKDAAMARVASLLETAKLGARGERVACGGGYDAERRVAEPTVVVCGWDSDLMREEAFAPILCVVPYDDLQEATAMVRRRPKPLAMYVFSRDAAEQRAILDNTTAGGVSVNGVLYHAGHSALPFGGVGESGAGAYHGKHSIECFQHRKPVLKKWRGIGDGGVVTDPFFVYGPHDGIKRKLLRAVAEAS
jgi:aldehyde dehydrogenase (NAD+)